MTSKYYDPPAGKDRLSGSSLLLVSLVAFIGLVFEAYVFSMYWGWFVVKQFNAPAISVLHALALLLMIGFVSYRKDYSGKTAPELIEILVKAVIAMIIYLAVGWVIYSLL